MINNLHISINDIIAQYIGLANQFNIILQGVVIRQETISDLPEPVPTAGILDICNLRKKFF